MKNEIFNPDVVKRFVQVTEKQVNNSDRTITQYISKANIDRDSDIVLPVGLDETNYRKNPIVLFNHKRDLIIGKNLWLKPDNVGVLSQTKFASTIFADDIFELHKGGFLNAWSISFMPKTWEYDDVNQIRVFTNWELLEYSSVSIPANPEAIDEAKSLIKSDLAKDLLFSKALENDVVKAMGQMTNLINSLIESQKEIKELLTNKDFNNQEKLEDSIFELNENIKNIQNKLTFQTKESLESLDNISSEEIKKLVVRELRRLTGRVD